MTDNEDERLDRAKRIRKMREGDDNREEKTEDTQPTQQDEPSEDNTGGDAGNDEQSGNDNSESGEMDNPEQDNSAESTETAPTETEHEQTAKADDDIRAPLPETEELEDALETSEANAETATPEEVAGTGTAASSGMLDEQEEHEEETRVLEFQLGDEFYCLDIDYIEEIVKEETITRVPNTPKYVEGVVDLRGQITTILNPKVTIEKEDTTPGGLIVVFDSESFEDQGHIGWVVDDVRQVSPITDEEVSEPPVQEAYINGVIDRDDEEQFVIWTNPEMAMKEAE
ncbi:chemotaxis protein CheW [Halovenus rubra]|uniref:Chemotaxis protein CheW n=2 Tax=Halovenus rubra TaxID=869890 RepID=A0ACC7DXC9_9EURY|nr:chemotaxis protein CheW [Halovenus rubra]